MKENPTLKVAQKPYNEGSTIQIHNKKKKKKNYNKETNRKINTIKETPDNQTNTTEI